MAAITAPKSESPGIPKGTAAPKTESSPDLFSQTVSNTADDWGVMGQKVGAFTLVAAGASILPMEIIKAYPSISLPAAIALSVGTLAGLAIEERKLGIGKNIGKVVGTALGTGAGAIKGSLGLHEKNSTEPIQLKRVDPESVKKHEPLAQRLLHFGQNAILGQDVPRTRAVEFGEIVGATAGVMATSYMVPKLVSVIAGQESLAAKVAGTLAGPIAGMVIGGWQESSLGLGRATGELVGSALSGMGIGNTMPADMKPLDAKGPNPEPGLVKKAFLSLNGAIAEPIVGPLVDTTVASNVLFSQAPVQTMDFTDKPKPKVNRERLIENYLELTSIFGPSGQEELVGAELIKRSEALGATTEMRDDGTVIATISASKGFEDAPTVLLSAHQDTVEATNPDAIRENDYKIYTDGKHILGADDRAGIAQIMEGVETVLETGQDHPEIKLVFPVDEERGLRGAGRLNPEDISERPTLGFVVDALDVDTLHLTNDAVILHPRSVKYTYNQADPVAQVALRSMAQAGTNPKVRHTPILTGAGSDANTPAFNSGHITTLAVGVGETNMHTGMEQIKKNDLERAARHVVGYITNSCDLKVVDGKVVPRQG